MTGPDPKVAPVPEAPASNRPWLMPLLVFLTALLISIVALLALRRAGLGNRSPDYLQYYEPVAARVVAGKGLVYGNGMPALRFPPGQVYFLASLFGAADLLHVSREIVVDVSSVMLHACATLLVWMLAARMWGGKKALVPAILWCTYLPALFFLPLGGSENVFIPLVLAIVYCFWKGLFEGKRTAAFLLLAGIGCSLAIYFRPIAVGMPVVLALVYLLLRGEMRWTRRLVHAGILVIAGWAPLIPWEVKLYHDLNRFELLSTAGFPSMVDGLTYATPSETRVPISVSDDVARFMGDVEQKVDQGQITGTGGLVRHVARQTLDQPMTVVRLFTAKAIRCWYATDSHRRERFLMLMQLGFGIFVAWGMWRVWRVPQWRRQLFWVVVPLVVYYWVMSTSVLSILRYMVPMMGLLFLVIPAVWSKRILSAR